ncbi:MAG: divergent polysaccharide deacetylase family protein, partial [Treponema sp.]|nr:divergent polysaccharide deacetylase family protein [Treponema sp.]
MAQKRSTTSKSKRKTQKKRTKKGKVYIAPYKLIILCAAVIALCMGLLVVSTAVNQRAFDKEQKQRIEQQREEEKRIAEKSMAEKQAAEKAAQEKKAEEKRIAEQKKQKEIEQKKAEEKKAEELKKQKEIEQKKAEEVKRQKEEARKAEEKRQKEAEQKKKAAPVKDEQPVRTPNTEAQLPKESRDSGKTKTEETSIPQPKKSEFNFPPAKNSAQLVILLDDGGQNLAHLQKFLDLPFPITIAVLPQLAHSKEAAAKIRAGGKELMLHQPMQAVNAGVNPGPGAITPNMDEAQIKATLFKNINEIGPVAGFNNHEGSLITADAEKMETVLKYASENGIYFLDSRTNVNTSVPAVASALGLSYYERNGRFLD